MKEQGLCYLPPDIKIHCNVRAMSKRCDIGDGAYTETTGPIIRLPNRLNDVECHQEVAVFLSCLCLQKHSTVISHPGPLMLLQTAPSFWSFSVITQKLRSYISYGASELKCLFHI